MHCQTPRKRVPAALRLGWRLPPQPPASGGAPGSRFAERPPAWTPLFPSAQADGRPPARQERFQSLAVGVSFPDNSCPDPADGVPGFGWKVATTDATTRHAPMWAPAAPFVLLANRLPGVYDRLWQRVQRAGGQRGAHPAAG